MCNKDYLITVTNFFETSEKLLSVLSSRGVKIKKSDMKQALSNLMGFETSNVLDAKLKAEKKSREANSQFDRSGRHKTIPSLILNSSKNPCKISDEIRKHKSYRFVVNFSMDFHATGGYKFETDFIIFSNCKYTTIKTILNWDSVTNLEYKYLKEEEEGGYLPDHENNEAGYWLLTFSGNGDQQFMGTDGTRYMDSIRLDGEHINYPNAPIELVTEFFIDCITQPDGETFFSIDTRDNFFGFLDDWLEEFYIANRKFNNECEFEKHIIDFLPYISVDDIAEMEIGDANIAFIKKLRDHGADLKRANLLYRAIEAGNIEASKHLLDVGNRVDSLDLFHSENSQYHQKAYFYFCNSEETLESAKLFYSTVVVLGISLDIPNDHGESPLHVAAESGNEKLYQHLMSLGANPDLKNQNGNTPKALIKTYLTEKQKADEKNKAFLSRIFESVNL